MDRDTKYDALYDQLNEIIETFGKVLEMYMANLNANEDYLEHPMHLPEKFNKLRTLKMIKTCMMPKNL